MSEELDVDTLKDILTDFAPRMGAKWDIIGIQLRQRDLVQNLRASPQLGSLKVQQIIDEWLGSEGKDVPACVATMSRVLRSEAVRLGAVAKDFEREVQKRVASQRAAQQRPVTHSLDEHPSTGANPSTGVLGREAQMGPFGKDDILFQKVFEHPDHRILFRKYVSRGAAGKGRAVLEGVGLDVPTIEECYSAHPLNEEEAVQDGLTRWCEGQGIQPPTWITLLEAMEYAGLARHNVQGLKEELGIEMPASRHGPPQPESLSPPSDAVSDVPLEDRCSNKSLIKMSEELDVVTLKDILTDFAPRMGPKWDFIGIQLRQGDLVQDLRASPHLGRQKVQQIIEEWLGSEDKDVPVCAETMSRVLRSKAVRLGAVAKDFEREVQKRVAIQRAAQQRPVTHSLDEHPSTGVYPSTGSDSLSAIPDIKAEYVKVKGIFVNVCTAQGTPTLDEVKDLCIDLVDVALAHIPIISRHRNDIEKAMTMSELARIVCFRLSSWLNYEFFKKVIAYFQPALKYVQQQLMHYEEQLKSLLLRKLEHIAELQLREDAPGNMAELVAKYRLHADDLLVKDLIAERDFLAQRLGIPMHLLQVLSWGGGTSQDLLKFEQQYSEVVRNQASITVRITKCTTIGPPRMGKTCFKHLLTGTEWDVKAGTASTDVMEAPEWVECYSLEEGGAKKPWKLLSAEQQQGELIRAVNALTTCSTQLTNPPSDAPSTTPPSDVQHSAVISDATTTTAPSDAHHSSPPSDAQHLTTSSEAPLRSTSSSAPPPTTLPTAQKPATIQQALEALAGAVDREAVQKFLKDKAGKVLGETRLVHFVDTGGQSVYHDVHPVLITSPSVYLVVFSLEELHRKSDEDQLQYFRSDLIQRPLRSIYTFGAKNPQEKRLRIHPEAPTIFIVGTHLDKITESDRKGILSKLHEIISTEIANKPYRQFVRHDTAGQSFWAVDNTLAGREQDEAVNKYISTLRLMVQDQSMEMSVDIPLPWMLLKLVMEGKGMRYCKYTELLKEARERGYVRESSPDADLDSMLKLFHILSLIYHKVPKGYTKEDSLVFIDPDCLYSATSDFLMAAKEEIKESSEGRPPIQAATREDVQDSQGGSEEEQQQNQVATKDRIRHGEELAAGKLIRKQRIIERMRDNMKMIEQDLETVVQKAERIMAGLGQEPTHMVLGVLQDELKEIGQQYKLLSMECPDASSQEAKRQLFIGRLVNSLASSVDAILQDSERKGREREGDVHQVRKEVAKAVESMKALCQRRSIDTDMDQLLSILSDLRIIAQLNDPNSLVVPAALPKLPHPIEFVGTVDPILVTVVSQTIIQVCYLPSGLFCCLISELVTGLGWSVVPLGRTHVAFMITHKDIAGRVHITERESYIKIDMESRASLEELSETCQYVRKKIHDSIVSVYTNLLGDTSAGPTFEESLSWGFHCEEHPDDDTHIAAYYEEDDEIDRCTKCLNDTKSFFVQEVKLKQVVWFSSKLEGV